MKLVSDIAPLVFFIILRLSAAATNLSDLQCSRVLPGLYDCLDDALAYQQGDESAQIAMCCTVLSQFISSNCFCEVCGTMNATAATSYMLSAVHDLGLDNLLTACKASMTDGNYGFVSRLVDISSMGVSSRDRAGVDSSVDNNLVEAAAVYLDNHADVDDVQADVDALHIINIGLEDATTGSDDVMMADEPLEDGEEVIESQVVMRWPLEGADAASDLTETLDIPADVSDGSADDGSEVLVELEYNVTGDSMEDVVGSLQQVMGVVKQVIRNTADQLSGEGDDANTAMTLEVQLEVEDRDSGRKAKMSHSRSSSGSDSMSIGVTGSDTSEMVFEMKTSGEPADHTQSAVDRLYSNIFNPLMAVMVPEHDSNYEPMVVDSSWFQDIPTPTMDAEEVAAIFHANDMSSANNRVAPQTTTPHQAEPSDIQEDGDVAAEQQQQQIIHVTSTETTTETEHVEFEKVMHLLVHPSTNRAVQLQQLAEVEPMLLAAQQELASSLSNPMCGPFRWLCAYYWDVLMLLSAVNLVGVVGMALRLYYLEHKQQRELPADHGYSMVPDVCCHVPGMHKIEFAKDHGYGEVTLSTPLLHNQFKQG